MLPKEFYVPWADIDPTLKDGGIPGELDGQFVGPRFGDNTATRNEDLYGLFRVVNQISACISMSPNANTEGLPIMNDVDEVLRALNTMIERVKDRTTSSACKIMQWCHVTPCQLPFRVKPVRWPLRNDFLHSVVYNLIGLQGEIVEMNSNAFHSKLDPSTCVRLLGPLMHVKAKIALDYFDKEVAGDISIEEIASLFAGIVQPGPVIVPTDETALLPPMDKIQEAMTGIDLVQWYPSMAEWTYFGKKRDESYKCERIWQPEGSTGTTEDVAPEHPVIPPPPASVSVG